MPAVVAGCGAIEAPGAIEEAVERYFGSPFMSCVEASDRVLGDVLPETVRACVGSAEAYQLSHASALDVERNAPPGLVASVYPVSPGPLARICTSRADSPLGVTWSLLLAKDPVALLFHGPPDCKLELELNIPFPNLGSPLSFPPTLPLPFPLDMVV